MKANEDNFISLIKKRREEGIRYVMEQYGGLLASIVGKRLYCMPDRIDECMNDIFFGIWNHIGSYDPERSSFKNWAAGVARFHAIDYLRKYGRQLDQTALEEVELAEEDENLRQLVEQELSEETQALLACLKPKDREVFTRLFLQEQDVETVSAQMGIPREAVYNKVSRGKRKMRRLAESSGR